MFKAIDIVIQKAICTRYLCSSGQTVFVDDSNTSTFVNTFSVVSVPQRRSDSMTKISAVAGLPGATAAWEERSTSSFSVPLCPSCFFLFFCLPEMKGRSVEKLEEMFQDEIPARHFSKH